MKESSCSQRWENTQTLTYLFSQLSVFFRANIAFLLLSQNSIIISQKKKTHGPPRQPEGFLKLTELKKNQKRKKETQ